MKLEMEQHVEKENEICSIQGQTFQKDAIYPSHR